MRTILVILALVVSSPASAGVIYDYRTGTFSEFVDPPAHWFEKPAPAEINIEAVPSYRIGKVCKENALYSDIACATVYRWGVCNIYISTHLQPDVFAAVMRHERAHCHGWPADHPLDPIPRLRDDYVASSVSQTD